MNCGSQGRVDTSRSNLCSAPGIHFEKGELSQQYKITASILERDCCLESASFTPRHRAFKGHQICATRPRNDWRSRMTCSIHYCKRSFTIKWACRSFIQDICNKNIASYEAWFSQAHASTETLHVCGLSLNGEAALLISGLLICLIGKGFPA